MDDPQLRILTPRTALSVPVTGGSRRRIHAAAPRKALTALHGLRAWLIPAAAPRTALSVPVTADPGEGSPLRPLRRSHGLRAWLIPQLRILAPRTAPGVPVTGGSRRRIPAAAPAALMASALDDPQLRILALRTALSVPVTGESRRRIPAAAPAALMASGPG